MAADYEKSRNQLRVAKKQTVAPQLLRRDAQPWGCVAWHFS
jgi:hypothetical protein